MSHGGFNLHFSVCHQVEASAVHQVGADSNSAPVLGLRPLNKSLRVHIPRPVARHQGPGYLRGRAGSQGVIRVRPAEFTRLKGLVLQTEGSAQEWWSCSDM